MLSLTCGSHSLASKYRIIWDRCFHLLWASIRSCVPFRSKRFTTGRSGTCRDRSNSARTLARPRLMGISRGYLTISLGTYNQSVRQIIIIYYILLGAILDRGPRLFDEQYQRSLQGLCSEPVVGMSSLDPLTCPKRLLYITIPYKLDLIILYYCSSLQFLMHNLIDLYLHYSTNRSIYPN